VEWAQISLWPATHQMRILQSRYALVRRVRSCVGILWIAGFLP
jgi:hypothetical protein